MFLNTELFGHQRGASNKGYKKIKYGTMVLSTQNLHLGNANVNLRFQHGMVSPAYKTYDIIGCSVELLAHWIKSDAAKHFFYNATTVGASMCRRNVEWETLYEQPLFLPSDNEQDKIASFLSVLAQRIDLQQKYVAMLKKYKRGAVSRLLNGTLTFNDCSDTESWQLRRVGDFCEVQMCKRVFKEQTTPDGDVPFYKIGTIGGLPDAYISRFLYEDYKRKYSFPRKGEFLISCAGTVGKCVLYNGEDAYYQDSNIVWLRNNSPDVSNDYLFVLVSNVDWTTLNSTTITRIYNDNLRDLRFYIPPMQIQKRIVDYIFTLSSRIDIEQMMLDKLQQERMGLLQQLFI